MQRRGDRLARLPLQLEQDDERALVEIEPVESAPDALEQLGDLAVAQRIRLARRDAPLSSSASCLRRARRFAAIRSAISASQVVALAAPGKNPPFLCATRKLPTRDPSGVSWQITSTHFCDPRDTLGAAQSGAGADKTGNNAPAQAAATVERPRTLYSRRSAVAQGSHSGPV